MNVSQSIFRWYISLALKKKFLKFTDSLWSYIAKTYALIWFFIRVNYDKTNRNSLESLIYGNETLKHW